MAERALEDFRILELADGKGHYCGKLLADLGAEVIKIEPPGGSPTRQIGPFKDNRFDPEQSLYFTYYNTNKKSVVIDLETTAGKKAFKELIQGADALVETLAPGDLKKLGLGYSTLKRINPGLVMASITGFGQSGPYVDYKPADIVNYALGGLMAVSGDPERPPLVPPGEQTYQAASIHAAYGVLHALYNRMATGKGQYIDLSVHEIQASEQHYIVNYSSSEMIPDRVIRRIDGGSGPSGIYPCKDGFAHLFVMAPAHWRSFFEWMGSPELFADRVWENRHFRAQNIDVLDPFVLEFTANMTKQQIFREGQDRHLPMTPINTVEDFATDPHEAERKFFVEISHPKIGRFRSPGSPYRLSQSTWEIQRPAPLIGEHTNEVLGKPRRIRVHDRTPAPQQQTKKLPMEGIRVIDFTQAIAGPYCSKLLGEYGAEVIKLESMAHQQRGRVNARLDQQIALRQRVTFADINREKLDAALNMATEKGQAIAKRLIGTADVVVENFSPRVMRHWGLDYPNLQQLRPEIIMVSLPGYGLSGPYSEFLSVAPSVMAITGITNLWAHPDQPTPVGVPTWQPDYGGGVHGAVAVLAALHQRTKTGKGQHIEVAQVETAACLMGPAYLEYFVNHTTPQPQGNSSAHAAPHGCYPCKGMEQWCTIAIYTDEEWKRFCDMLDNPSWAEDPKFATVAGRVANHKELDEHVATWTATQTPFQVMRTLQREGIAAGAVQNAEDLFRDPQLWARNFLVDVKDPGLPGVVFPGSVIHFSDTPGKVTRGAEFGEHNAYVYQEILGMSSKEMADLIEEGVIG